MFEPKDSDSLFEAIKKAVNFTQEEITQMSNFSREKMEKEFDREIVIEKYLYEIND